MHVYFYQWVWTWSPFIPYFKNKLLWLLTSHHFVQNAVQHSGLIRGFIELLVIFTFTNIHRSDWHRTDTQLCFSNQALPVKYEFQIIQIHYN
jgi:hypothetical protein